MRKRLLLGLLVMFFSAFALGQVPVLHVYGPGGPLGPMQECADLFAKTNQVSVVVIAGPEPKWFAQAQTNADVVFGGAEYMLTDFGLRHAGFLDEQTRTELYIRPAGILVRKGNPKKIASLADLARPGIRIIDVNGAGQLGLWEDLAGRAGVLEALQKNIAQSVSNSAEAIERWKTDSSLDAWITYDSWHYRLRDVTDLVRMPESERLYRGTPIAIAKATQNRAMAVKFIAFLKSEPAHAVFQKWGWR